MIEQGDLAELAADVGEGEDEKGDDDGQVEGLGVEERVEDLDAFLQVDEGDVEVQIPCPGWPLSVVG